MGAYLAEPRSQEVNDNLFNFVRNFGSYGFWVGATDSANEGTWVWQSDGEVLSYDNWPPGYTNQEDKDCLLMTMTDGSWRYFNCDATTYSFCQKKSEGNVHVLLRSSFKKSSLSHKTYIFHS